jgi:hypothetical protein
MMEANNTCILFVLSLLGKRLLLYIISVLRHGKLLGFGAHNFGRRTNSLIMSDHFIKNYSIHANTVNSFEKRKAVKYY